MTSIIRNVWISQCKKGHICTASDTKELNNSIQKTALKAVKMCPYLILGYPTLPIIDVINKAKSYILAVYRVIDPLTISLGQVRLAWASSVSLGKFG